MTITARHTQKHLGRGLAALVGAAMLTSCAVPEASQGVSIREASPRIVSLNPCTDAILVEVAAPHQVLAISHYSHSPASSSIPQERAREFGATSGTVEEVLALDPDMVLASTFLAPATGQAMRELDVRFRTFASPQTVEDSLAQVRYVGTLARAEAQAKDLAMQIKAALWRHGAPRGHEPISTVLWQPGEIVPGESELISELLREAGFASHSAALGMGQADYLPLEVLLANPPDLLLVAGDNPGQRHPLLDQLQGTRVEAFDPNLLYCGGPTIIRAMERLAEIRESMQAETQS